MPAEDKSKSAKDIVKDYLEKRAAEDPQFAQSYAKPQKSIDECWLFIIGEARKRGSAVCLSDAEVFGLAVHYYDENDIKINRVAGARVSTSEQPKAAAKLTAKEKAEAKEEARRIYQRQCLEDLAKKEKPAKKKPAVPADVQQTPSLFGDMDF